MSVSNADQLKNKVCLITGASRTLGAEIARCMARNGAHVAVNYHRSQDAALALCRELNDLGVKTLMLAGRVMLSDWSPKPMSNSAPLTFWLTMLARTSTPPFLICRWLILIVL